MVAVYMNIMRCVVWLAVTFVEAIIKVEGDIKEVNDFVICFNGDSQVMVFEDFADFLLDQLSLSFRFVTDPESIISVQPQVDPQVPQFLEEVQADQLTCFRSIVTTHCDVKGARGSSLGPGLAVFVQQGVLCQNYYLLILF